jgi:hypothetical protein
MKKEHLLILILGAGFVYHLYTMRKMVGGASTQTASSLNNAGMVGASQSVTSEINNTALPGQPGWGWKYYTDGTSIGPDGKYYSGSNLTFDPMGYMGVLK